MKRSTKLVTSEQGTLTLETTLETDTGDTVALRQELQRSDALDMITALADWVSSPERARDTPIAPEAKKVEAWEYEIEHVCRMTFEPAREVTCGCGRKGAAYTMSTVFVGAPDRDPVRWVRPPPGWFVCAGADPRRIDAGKNKILEGPFFRCTVCMSEWKPPPLR